MSTRNVFKNIKNLLIIKFTNLLIQNYVVCVNIYRTFKKYMFLSWSRLYLFDQKYRKNIILLFYSYFVKSYCNLK